MKVIATERGYFGGAIREMGERFDVPDEIWNDEKRRPSWAQPAKSGGKVEADEKAAPEAEKPKGRKVKAEPAEPFADAPEPVEVKSRGNGLKEALGVDPDWIAPKPID